MLDDLRRVLRMDSPAPRLSESNLRKLSRGLRSSKKSRLSVHSTLDTHSVQDGSLGGRSVSLSTLLPSGGVPGSVPRVDKLQTLEAKMANIEMSLGWRRRREALLETLPRAARDLVRELDSLHQSVKEKDTYIQGLRTQITNLGGTVAGASDGGGGGFHISETEKRAIQERLDKVEAEMDAKKVSVKNIKLTLDKIDVTDNIDVRIRAAELEYELEREELNILNLKEEVLILTTKLQESNVTVASEGNSNGHAKGCSFHDLLSIPGSASAIAGASLAVLTVTYTPGNPPFHVICKPPFGCAIDWASDDTRLKKGDRIVEINREYVIGKPLEEVTKLMSESPLLSLVVARPSELPNGGKKLDKQLEDKVKENKELSAKLEKAVKERDSFQNDNTRLNHRISYLEDQVSELQGTIKKAKEAAIISGSPNEVLTPSHPGATIIQVFQKGEKTLAVAGPDLEKTEDRVQEYPTLPRIKSPSSSSTGSGSTSRIEEKDSPIKDHESSCERVRSPPCSEKSECLPIPRNSSRTPSERSFYSTRHSDSLQNSHYRNSQDFLNRTHTPSYIEDYADYHRINFSSRGTSRKSDPVATSNGDNRIYDSIDQLRDKIAERSPSYSYKNHDSFSIDASDKYEDKKRRETHRLKRRENENNFENIYDGQTVKHSKRSGSEVEYRISNEGRVSIPSRPSSRENFIDSPNGRYEDERQSRSTLTYERPPRRVLSPASEDSRTIRPRPIPPKKPERLSLQRTTSMMSVEDSRPCSRASPNAIMRQQNGNQSYASQYDSDATLDDCNSIYSEDKGLRFREGYSRRPSSRVSSICEERYPNPSPKSETSKVPKMNGTTPTLSRKDQRRLTISSIDSSIYDSPLANSSPAKLNGHHNNYSRSKSPNASFHLDSTLGLDHHQDVRAQPLYEYIPRVGLNGSHFPKASVRKSLEKEVFQAPPTPNTPPRGINLSMSSPQKNSEEWC